MTSGMPINERRCPIVHCDKPERAAHLAVEKAFLHMGIDIHDPEAMRDFKASQAFTVDMYKLFKKSMIAAIAGIVTVAVCGIAAIIWGYIKSGGKFGA